jgi:hypothetical protein
MGDIAWWSHSETAFEFFEETIPGCYTVKHCKLPLKLEGSGVSKAAASTNRNGGVDCEAATEAHSGREESNQEGFSCHSLPYTLIL